MTSHHEFTVEILTILKAEFSDTADEIFAASELIRYLNVKTRSASRGSKARGSFGNHYALYVLVEDYIARGFLESGDYESYSGARYTDLMNRQRELPFGSRLQNHALNHRLNQEFHKYFPISDYVPIVRDPQTSRYWINENLLKVPVGRRIYNIATVVIAIIEAYVAAKQDAFKRFISDCERLQRIQADNPAEARQFIGSLLDLNVDARIFEIASYAILRPYYGNQSIYWGWEEDEIQEEALILYKTGRTNANDGGIDFVMRPLGRFFQVTESLDFKKYFLDIEKVHRYPITFVIKSDDAINDIEELLRAEAQKTYSVRTVVDRYMDSVEELLNIPILLSRLDEVMKAGGIQEIVNELVTQSRLEFNLPVE